MNPFAPPPPLLEDTENWEMLEFELEDDDWVYDAGELYAKDLYANVGIGVDNPQAKLHVEEENRGRMLFDPVTPLHHWWWARS